MILGLLAPSVLGAFQKLDSSDLRSVSGKAGLRIDIDPLDISVNSLQAIDPDGDGTGNLGSLLVNNLDVGSGLAGEAGGASLDNMTLDVSSSNGLAASAPSGNFSFGFDNICIEDSQSTNCGGTASLFGLGVSDISLSGSILEIQGLGEGLTSNIDLNNSISAINLRDADGSTNGSNTTGSLTLQGISINSSGILNQFTINVDGNTGMVLTAPSGDISGAISTFCINTSLAGDCSSGQVFGSSSFSSLNFNGTELRAKGIGQGLIADLDLDIQLERISYEDNDGGSCVGCSGNTGTISLGNGNPTSIQVGNGSTGIATLNNFTINIEGSNNALALDAPSGQVTLDIDDVKLGTNSSALGLEARGINLSPAAGQTSFELSAN